MERKQVIELIDKYRKGTQTPEEKAIFESWYIHEAANSGYEIGDKDLERNLELIAKNLPLKYKQTYSIWPRMAVASRIAIAAAVLLVVGLGAFFYINSSRHVILNSFQDPALASNNIKPGSNKAYLVLSNGKRLSLTDAANGAIAKEAGVEITKTADGQVIYKAASDNTPSDNNGDISGRHPELVSGPPLNTIETPRGGQYQIRLPDGSKVWLNAASKLIYPVTFTGRGQREVELSGEAYFEIFKNKLQPFVVKSKNQEVTVLGTHFNICAYKDDLSTKTTLLEGSVRVRSFKQNAKDLVLKPNQQAVLDPDFQIRLQETINLEYIMAWRSGNFYFLNENLKDVMRKIARWYDVDIVYQTEPGDVMMTGVITKKASITEVLHLIESTAPIHFKIEGRRVIATK